MAVRYHEMVLAGPRGQALAFVQGFLCGRGIVGNVLDAEAEGFDCESLRERIRDFFRPGEETSHLLVPRRLVRTVKTALAEAKRRDLPLALRHERPLLGARLAFSFDVYSREHGRRIRDRFRKLPAGVSLTAESTIEESLRPEDAGIEAYAPAHDYELRGRGAVEGPLEGVLDLWRYSRDEDLVRGRAPELIGEEKAESS